MDTVSAARHANGSAPTATRVVVCCRCRLFGEGLARLLDGEPTLEVVGAASDVDGAVRLARESLAHVALVDLSTPQRVAAVRDVVSRRPDMHVIGVAFDEDVNAVIAAAEAGVAAFLNLHAGLDELRATIVSAARGEMLCSPRVAAILRRHVTALGATRPAGGRLTRRETAIMTLVEEGLSNRAIAERLCIELSTVKNHLRNVFDKLQVERRADAVACLREERVEH